MDVGHATGRTSKVTGCAGCGAGDSGHAGLGLQEQSQGGWQKGPSAEGAGSQSEPNWLSVVDGASVLGLEVHWLWLTKPGPGWAGGAMEGAFWRCTLPPA